MLYSPSHKSEKSKSWTSSGGYATQEGTKTKNWEKIVCQHDWMSRQRRRMRRVLREKIIVPLMSRLDNPTNKFSILFFLHLVYFLSRLSIMVLDAFQQRLHSVSTLSHVGPLWKKALLLSFFFSFFSCKSDLCTFPSSVNERDTHKY